MRFVDGRLILKQVERVSGRRDLRGRPRTQWSKAAAYIPILTALGRAHSFLEVVYMQALLDINQPGAYLLMSVGEVLLCGAILLKWDL